MDNSKLYIKENKSFEQFASDLLSQAHVIVISVDEVGVIHANVTRALNNIPVEQDIDNVVRAALMEGILRGEMVKLLASVESLREVLTDSVSILIKNGDAVLMHEQSFPVVNYQNPGAVENARAKIAMSLELLKDTRRRLACFSG